MTEENYDRELARVIDHTLLRTDAKKEDFDRVCEEAKRYHFRSVCVFSGDVEYVAQKLEGSDVIPIAVVGFPHGQMTPVAKAFEAHDAIANRGAQEIDMVIHVSAIKSKHYILVLEDIQQVVKACGDKPVKVIIETALLTDTEKIAACTLAKTAGARFIKTSTGKEEGGATVEDVRLDARGRRRRGAYQSQRRRQLEGFRLRTHRGRRQPHRHEQRRRNRDG